MFKKFNPKEDIASSTAIKSSVQRSHRSKLLSQLPYLSLPASLPSTSTLTSTIHHKDETDSDSDEEIGAAGAGGGGRKKGAGKEKREKKLKEAKEGGGKGGKRKGHKAAQEEATVEEPLNDQTQGEEQDVLTVLDLIWPKKAQITFVKCREHISILVLNGEPLFFQHFDGPYFPTLRLLHKYPGMLPKVGVDRGAIKFVLSGANIMCPGLTSPTAYLPPTSSNIGPGQPVAVHAYGKELPLAIGLTSISSDEIRTVNKGCGVENVAFLGDDLWRIEKL